MLDEILLNDWVEDIQDTLKTDDLDQIQMIVGGICIEIKAHLQENGLLTKKLMCPYNKPFNPNT